MPLPPNLRPSLLIRRKAMRHGVFGESRFWKVVAYTIIVKQTFRRVFGKQAEVLEVAKLKGGGHWMQIETFAPTTRRQRRRAAR